ncbi:2-isopropylmalate synthase [Nostoc sp. ChiQUE01b]|uniref:2-isopropylmalate synthase n=1 Tax=Nostoc sp. ChiQUE01b TaxID=3075376 RepID=UPI002AD5A789|nr:2-isopropylmalate synthase [Nostoc sp. ChiQUE01b]MDZ8261978.1 2-isopropylmalate synthase [Nostoc sp. ChiQUE01b]
MVADNNNLKDVYFSDTTLRDGEQMPGASLTPEEKVEIAKALAKAGIHSLDAGFPACASSEIEAIQGIVKEVKGPVISALCRALDSDIDKAYEALAEAEPYKRAVSIFVATSPIHREYKLRKSKAQLLEMIVNAIHYARQKFEIIAFSPEDASRTELNYLCEIYQAAIEAGATTIGFPDTVGILTPEKTRITIRYILNHVPNIARAFMAVHFHNDLGLATSNTLAALEEGVQIVQCAVNGIGERAGNTALEEVVIALLLNQEQYQRAVGIDPKQLVSLSKLVAEKTSIPIAPNKAVVGSNIFATEAGIHQDGILKNLDTYLPFRPEMVGAEGIQIVLGKHSGRAAIAQRLKKLNFCLTEQQLDLVVAALKDAKKNEWLDAERLFSQTVKQLFGEQASFVSDLNERKSTIEV